MKPFWKTKLFQLRWNEALGKPECPYAYRYVLIFFGFSIRVHVWHRSDDKRYLHNHSWWFITFVLKGNYTDVSVQDNKRVYDYLERFSLRYRPSNHTHYVDVPKGGCTTILFTGRPLKKWGFFHGTKFLRPLKHFDKLEKRGIGGHPDCQEQ